VDSSQRRACGSRRNGERCGSGITCGNRKEPWRCCPVACTWACASANIPPTGTRVHSHEGRQWRPACLSIGTLLAYSLGPCW
jgi:hypothetical protein